MSNAVHLHLGSPTAQTTTPVTRPHHYLPSSRPPGVSFGNFFTTISRVLTHMLGSKVPRPQVFPSPSPVRGADHRRHQSTCALWVLATPGLSEGSPGLCVGHATPDLPWPCYGRTLLSSRPPAAPPRSPPGPLLSGRGMPFLPHSLGTSSSWRGSADSMCPSLSQVSFPISMILV